jgi:AraC-like DNA-binding protein
VPARERADTCRDFFAGLGARYFIEPLRDMPFEIDVKLQALPGVTLMSGTLQGSRDGRSREMLADGNDDIGLMVNLGAPYLITQGREDLTLAAGEATLVSLADVCSFTHPPPGHLLAMRFPRAQLASRVAGLEDQFLRCVSRENPALRLLTGYAKLAFDEQTAGSRELPPLVAAHIQDLVAVAVGATRDAAEAAQGRGVRAARLHAIKQDIARSLDKPDLSVTVLGARHRCTPRFIQRLFEAEGTTFTEYVLAQRLARAHRTLLDPRRAGEKVSVVAYDCGFGDLSYFNRVFRRHYGAAPSDIRAKAQRDASTGLM